MSNPEQAGSGRGGSSARPPSTRISEGRPSGKIRAHAPRSQSGEPIQLLEVPWLTRERFCDPAKRRLQPRVARSCIECNPRS